MKLGVSRRAPRGDRRLPAELDGKAAFRRDSPAQICGEGANALDRTIQEASKAEDQRCRCNGDHELQSNPENGGRIPLSALGGEIEERLGNEEPADERPRGSFDPPYVEPDCAGECGIEQNRAKPGENGEREPECGKYPCMRSDIVPACADRIQPRMPC